MSDDINNNQQEQVEDQSSGERPIENLKSEFDRKLNNLQETIREQTEALKAQNQYISEQLQQTRQPAPVADEEVDYFDNPDKFIEQKLNKKLQNFEQNITQKQAQQTELVNTMSRLQNDFPELKNPQSDFYKTADRLLSAYPKEQQSNPTIIKAAIYEAAVQSGVNPVSKRQTKTQQEYTFSGSKSGDDAPDDSGELPKEVEHWRRVFQNYLPKDKGVKKRIKQHSERPWNRYMPVKKED